MNTCSIRVMHQTVQCWHQLLDWTTTLQHRQSFQNQSLCSLDVFFLQALESSVQTQANLFVDRKCLTLQYSQTQNKRSESGTYRRDEISQRGNKDHQQTKAKFLAHTAPYLEKFLVVYMRLWNTGSQRRCTRRRWDIATKFFKAGGHVVWIEFRKYFEAHHEILCSRMQQLQD